MSNYSISDIENLIKRCNKSNKKIIISTIKEIIEEDDSLNVKLLNIENINNNFFKNLSTKNNKSSFCTICQDKIKSKEHKIKLFQPTLSSYLSVKNHKSSPIGQKESITRVICGIVCSKM